MESVKRVEIVIDSLDLDGLVADLDRLGVHDYTAMTGVAGRGSRGERGGDPFSGAFDNAYVLIACSPDALEPVIETVRGLLERRGGMCLVSDAAWVKH